MFLFRLVLVIFLITIVAYTVIVGTNHGWNLFPIFFNDMIAMNWQGQFNLDFTTFLALSCIWVMWRNGFSLSGIGLGVVAFFGGMLFLSIYLLILSFRTQGDIRQIMLGVHNS